MCGDSQSSMTPLATGLPAGVTTEVGGDVQTNSLDLRDAERQRSKPAATYRILVRWDSITFGWGVPFENTFCPLLEKSLNAELNTAMEVAYLKSEGVSLKPDLVLFAWFVNDAEPRPLPRRSWLAHHSYA